MLNKYKHAFQQGWFKGFLALGVTYLLLGGVAERTLAGDTERTVTFALTVAYFLGFAYFIRRGLRTERNSEGGGTKSSDLPAVRSE